MWFLFVILVIVLLLVFPRQVLPILVAVAAVLGGAGGWYWWQYQQEQEYLEAVAVDVAYAPTDCPADKPLLVSIKNGSPLTVASVEWQFSARRAGYRGELTGDWSAVHVYEGPLAEGEQYRECFVAPSPNKHVVKRDADELANLELGIRSMRVDFGQ